jgi:hypothetical protein
LHPVFADARRIRLVQSTQLQVRVHSWADVRTTGNCVQRRLQDLNECVVCRDGFDSAPRMGRICSIGNVDPIR